MCVDYGLGVWIMYYVCGLYIIVMSGGMWPACVSCRPRVVPKKKPLKNTASQKAFLAYFFDKIGSKSTKNSPNFLKIVDIIEHHGLQ